MGVCVGSDGDGSEESFSLWVKFYMVRGKSDVHVTLAQDSSLNHDKEKKSDEQETLARKKMIQKLLKIV